MKNVILTMMTLGVVFWGAVPVHADCPTADLTGDCFVDMEDLAVFAGQWLTGDGIPADMAFIPGGTFQMGDSFEEGYVAERPVHTVTLDAFYIGKTLITHGQYAAFLTWAINNETIYINEGIVYGSGNDLMYCDTSANDDRSQLYFMVIMNPRPPFNIISRSFYVSRKLGRSMADDPMMRVTWYGAVAYANWRSEQEGREPCYDLATWECDFDKDGYRLPTEAQWEYAARGGLAGKRFPRGDTINHDHANYRASGTYDYDTTDYSEPTYHPGWNDGSRPYSSPVGTFLPNGYGLYDMAGNASEWCNDTYSWIYYQNSPEVNPTGPGTEGFDRVVRSGSWGLSAYTSRVAGRFSSDPSQMIYQGGGFRLVLKYD